MEGRQAGWLYLILLATIASAGCELVEGVFKAGFVVGLLVVTLVVALILFVVVKLRG